MQLQIIMRQDDFLDDLIRRAVIQVEVMMSNVSFQTYLSSRGKWLFSCPTEK